MKQFTLQTFIRCVHCKKVLSQLSRESEVLVFNYKESYFIEVVTILQKAKRILIVRFIELFLFIFSNCITAGNAFLDIMALERQIIHL